MMGAFPIVARSSRGDRNELRAIHQIAWRPGPPAELSPALKALWWDAKGDWAQAHAQVDDLETPEAMAVHAYLHRKEGVAWNADYWYKRSGTTHRRPTLEAEWTALLEALLP